MNSDRCFVKILFLDQSGKSGGAELCLLDVAKPYQDSCLVGLFEDGSFRQLLQHNQIPVQVLSQKLIQVRKDSSWIKGLSSLRQLLPLVATVVQLSYQYDVIYVNTPKALVVGALAGFLSRRPLIYHLHDILSAEHFSATNRQLAVTLANRAALVIANSQASRDAFLEAGGRSAITKVVYNGFQPEKYQVESIDPAPLRSEMKLSDRADQDTPDRFLVGNFSRLSPWKGQHILIEALTYCPEDVTAVFVGDALFGEQAYVQQLHAQVEQLGLSDRVRFLGFRSEVVPLMAACDLVAHTSTAAEPFGRVIVEAMLCGKPVVATKAGGALELVDHGLTGWLVSPGDARQLAQTINEVRSNGQHTLEIAQRGRQQAIDRFHIAKVNQQIHSLLMEVANVT